MLDDAKNSGTYGAKVASWMPGNPRDLLRNIVGEKPGLRKAALLQAFRDAILEGENSDLLDTVIEYWFANNYVALTSEARPARAAQMGPSAVAAIAGGIKARAMNMVLMELVLPCGKALRECTGEECAIAGGWFTRIAERIGAEKIVGDELSESVLQKMFSEAAAAR